MNILVYPHQLVVGGSQINAIELAAAVRDRGHEVTVTAPQGTLASMIDTLDLHHVPVPVASGYPSARTAAHLVRLSKRLGADLIHAYEWRPAIEAAFGPHLFLRTPLLLTVLSMQVPAFLPSHLPLVVGTKALARQPNAARWVHVLEPPIDTRKNTSRDRASARARWSFRSDELVIAVVCRLTLDLEKLHGVLQAIDAVAGLATRWPFRFLVVGGGDGLGEVRRRAQAANLRAGGLVVVVAGEMLDPRDAYDAADVVLGMGSSALRGLAFAKPLIVQGENGFWRLLDESTVDLFLEQGWFGHGGGGIADLEPALELLARDPALRRHLGRYGRALVERRFSLDRAAERLVGIYEDVLSHPARSSSRWSSLCRSATRVAKFGAVNGLRAVSARGKR